MTSVAIVGAGITGLTAAWHLRRAGLPVTVYEASPRAGGVIRSFRDGDWLAEGGPNTMLETSPRLREFVDAVGLASRRVYSAPEASARYVVRDNRAVALPLSGPQFFLCSLFSLSAKLRLLREPFIAKGWGEETVASFVRRRLGQEFLDYAIDPLVTGIYAGDPAELSVQHAFPKIYALEVKYGSLIRGQLLGAKERKARGEVSKATAQKFSFDDGLQVLPDTLHAALRDEVRLSTPVQDITRTPQGYRVGFLGANGERGEADHPVVLLSSPAHALAKLPIRSHGAPSLAELDEIEYPPVTSVVLGFRRADVGHPCMGFGALVPHREELGILGTLFSSALFPRRAPAGHVTLTCYVGGARNPEAAAAPDGRLVDSVLGDLELLFKVTGKPVFTHIHRWPKAIPQYKVGYGQYKELFDELELKAPGIFAAGHFRDGVALSDSILAGVRAAERIQSFLQASSPAATTA